MMGGPGSGKSYIRKKRFGAEYDVLDCDQIKATHPDYNPKNAQALHEWSSQELGKRFHTTIGAGRDFVYDGTGGNAEKYVYLIRLAHSLGYHVTVCFVRCPLKTALRRNAARERVVDESMLRDKHSVIETSFELVEPHADTVTVLDGGLDG